MEHKTDDWLKDCEICNAGLCETIDDRKKNGLNESVACRQMAEESGGLYSEKQILDRYRYHTGKDKKVSEIPKVKVSDISDEEILQAARKISEERRKR